MSKAVIFFAPGLEECEGLLCVDQLRRSGEEVTIAAVGGEKIVKSARSISVVADALAEELDYSAFDAAILPGGMPGTLNLQKSLKVTAILNHCLQKEKLIAAICAVPMVLGGLGMLSGRRATCFPGFEDQLDGAVLPDDSVVRDGNFITARGAGTALEFGAAIVDFFQPGDTGVSKGARVLAQMQTPAHV